MPRQIVMDEVLILSGYGMDFLGEVMMEYMDPVAGGKQENQKVAQW